MASLRASIGIGTGSVSSLIKSAQSTQTALVNLDLYNADTLWGDSAKTSSDLADYTAKINDIIGRVQGNTTPQGIQKTESLRQKLISAQGSFNTAQIDRASIGILQGNYSQTDKVNMIADLYSRAADPAQQQRLLMQYDQAVKTLNDQRTTAANAATSNEQKGYTYGKTVGDALVKQIQNSIASGTNQVDPKILQGSQTFYIDPKTGTASATQTPGSKAVTVNLPAAGAKIDVTSLYHLMSSVMQLNAGNAYQAMQDPRLTDEQRASWESTYNSAQKELAGSIYTNAQLQTATDRGQAAIVREYVKGVGELKANTTDSGQLLINPSPQQVQNEIAAAKKSGNSANIRFVYTGADGVPTVYHLQNVGNAIMAFDASATDQTLSQGYLYDAQKGTLVPFNHEHQMMLNAARQSDPSNPLGNPNTVAIANGVQQNYINTHETGAAKVGDTLKNQGLVAGTIQMAKQDIGDVLHLHAPTYDPLGRLGHGIVGGIGSAYLTAAKSFGSLMGHTGPLSGVFNAMDVLNGIGGIIGKLNAKPITAPVVHPNVPPPAALPHYNQGPAPVPTPVQRAGGLPGTQSTYRQVADNHGGFNYFNGSTPITVQQYNAGTGQNISATARSGAAGVGTPDFLASLGV